MKQNVVKVGIGPHPARFLPNVTAAGAGGTARPVTVTGNDCGLPAALSVNTTEPETKPTTAGVTMTAKLQEAEGAKVPTVRQSGAMVGRVSANAPEVVTVEIVIELVPVLVSVPCKGELAM